MSAYLLSCMVEEETRNKRAVDLNLPLAKMFCFLFFVESPWITQTSLLDFFTFGECENIYIFFCDGQILNPSLAEHDMPCLKKLCRSRSEKPTDLDLHCLSLKM